MSGKAVLLDKDGTVSQDVGYLNDPNNLRLLPGSAEAIKKLNAAGYRVFIVSNQAGIARCLLNESILHAIDKRLVRDLLNQGAIIDEVYYCPHHPDQGYYPYRTDCSCRKPDPGMLKKAIEKYQIDVSRSFLIGDKKSDIEAGQKLGLKTVLVLTGYGEQEKEKFMDQPHPPSHIAKDLLNAVNWLLK